MGAKWVGEWQTTKQLLSLAGALHNASRLCIACLLSDALRRPLLGVLCLGFMLHHCTASCRVAAVAGHNCMPACCISVDCWFALARSANNKPTHTKTSTASDNCVFPWTNKRAQMIPLPYTRLAAIAPYMGALSRYSLLVCFPDCSGSN